MNLVNNTIWCVGRNFSEHARELSNPLPEKPLIFMKSWASIQSSRNCLLSMSTQRPHYELEIVLRLGKNLEITHLGLGLDLTDRSEQDIAKAKGLPWCLAKSFKGSTIVGTLLKVEPSSMKENLKFFLKKNGEVVQKGSSSQMIFSFDQIIDYLQKNFPLIEGDLIFTGTPSGVGPVEDGDIFVAEIEGLLEERWTFSRASTIPPFQGKLL